MQKLIQACIEYLFKSSASLSKHCEQVSRMVFAEEGLEREVDYVRSMIE